MNSMLRRLTLPSFLLSLCLGCSGPKMLREGSLSVEARGDGFTVQYIETPYSTNRPRLRLEYETPGRATVLLPDGKRLREFRNVFDRDEVTVELPRLTSDKDFADLQLSVAVDRHGEPRREVPMRVRLRRIDAPGSPATEESPSTPLAISYPLWGFWRDLLDAPFTMLNRAGLTTARLGDNQPNAANALVIGGAAVGGAIGFKEGFDHGDSGMLEKGFYGGLGGVAGAVGGALLAVPVAGAYEWIVVPIQTALFRTAIDVDFVKREPYAVQSVGDASADAAAYDERLRSFSYFPNWRFVVQGETAVPSPRSIQIWVVDAIELGAAARD